MDENARRDLHRLIIAAVVCAGVGILLGVLIATYVDLKSGRYSINFRLAILAAIATAAIVTKISEAISNVVGYILVLPAAATPAAFVLTISLAGFEGPGDLSNPFWFPIMVLGIAFAGASFVTAYISQSE